MPDGWEKLSTEDKVELLANTVSGLGSRKLNTESASHQFAELRRAIDDLAKRVETLEHAAEISA